MSVAVRRSVRVRRFVLATAVLAGGAMHASAASVTWTNGGDGVWTTAANWSSSPLLPGPADDVSNPTAFTITLSGPAQTINSFVSAGPLTLAGASGVLVGATPGTSAIQVNNTFSLTGGGLQDFIVNPGAGGEGITASAGASSLDAVTSNASLAITGGTIRTRNGFALNSTATISAGGLLASDTSQVYSGAGTILFGATGNNRLSIEGSTTLTIGSSTFVRGQNGQIGVAQFVGGAGRLVNNGTIAVDVAGGSITINPSTAIINNNVIAARNGGTLNLVTALTNNGSLNVDGSSVMAQGGITITGGSINVASGGAFRPTNSSANFLSGVTVNGGLDLATALATERVTGGFTLNGTVAINNGSLFTSEASQTFGGAGTIAFGATGNNRLSIEGSTTLTIGSSTLVRGQNGQIGVAQIVGGAGRLVNNGTIAVDVAGGSITLNPSTAIINNNVIAARNGGTLNLDTALTNNGQLLVDASSLMRQRNIAITGGSINVAAGGAFRPSNAASNFFAGVTVNGDLDLATTIAIERVTGGFTLNGTVAVNQGSLLASDATQTFDGVGTIVFGATGNNRLSVEGSTTLTLGSSTFVRGQNGQIGQAQFLGGPGRLVNNGTIAVDVAGGSITLNPSTAIINNSVIAARNGGTLNLDTVLTNNGQLLVDASSLMRQRNIAITGGSINVAAGGAFVPSNSTLNFLVGVTVNGNLDLASGLSVERTTGGFTLNGTVAIDNGSLFTSDATQTFDGAGTIVFGATGNNRLSVEGATTLTLGSAIIVRGQKGQIGQAQLLGGAGRLVNNGTIAVDVAGGSITINPSTAIINNNVIAALNGGRLNLNTAVTNGGTLLVSGADSLLFQNNIPITGGTIVADGGASEAAAGRFVPSSGQGNFLNSVTLRGGMDMASAAATQRVTGTLTLDDARIDLNRDSLLTAEGAAVAYSGVGTIVFGEPVSGFAASRLSIEGNSTLTLGSGIVIRGHSARIGAAQLAGGAGRLVNHGHIAADGGGVFTMNQSSTFDLATGSISASNGGRLITQNVSGELNGSFADGAGSVLRVSGTSTIDQTLQVTGGALVNLVGTWTRLADINASGALAFDYPVVGPSRLAEVEAAILTGRNGGLWNGAGIFSTAAAADPNTAVGWSEATLAIGGAGTFAGDTVDASAVLVRHTVLGDVNLDRVVDVTDLGRLASNWQATGRKWFHGDFSFDGVVDVSDLGALATNWQFGVTGPLAPSDPYAVFAAALAAVPEPGAGVVAALALLAAGRRRRGRAVTPDRRED